MVLKSERKSVYIHRIIDAFQKIEAYTKDINIDKLEHEPKTIDACLMQLIHIWETSNRIRKIYPSLVGIPIEQLIKFRNFAAHDYLWVNIGYLKRIIKNDLPDLKKKLSEYVKSL